jgi:hypothetical protein
MTTILSCCHELDCSLDGLNILFHLRLTCSQFPLPRFQVMQLRPQSRHLSQNFSLFGCTLVLIHNLLTRSVLRRVGNSFDIRRRRPMPSFDMCIQIPLPRKPSPVSSACRDGTKVFQCSMFLSFVSEKTCFVAKVDPSTRCVETCVRTSVLIHVFPNLC